MSKTLKSETAQMWEQSLIFTSKFIAGYRPVSHNTLGHDSHLKAKEVMKGQCSCLWRKMNPNYPCNKTGKEKANYHLYRCVTPQRMTSV